MEHFTNTELAGIRLFFGLAEGNALTAERLYRERCPHRDAPDHRLFANLHRNLCEYGSLREGRESIEDEPRSGRPSVSKPAANVVRVRDLVRSRSSLDSQNDWGRVEFESHTTVHQTLTNKLKMRKICAKLVPEKPFSVNRFLASKNIPVAPQHPYSPQLEPL
ncbi:uncharacterized protein TNCV_4525941 [Trichonephila clavipes]|nr:uncharacterized protein TNCV_4525941 [Trichonephila clavipes]